MERYMSLNTTYKIGIIGAGPVGCILAAHLHKSGEDVIILEHNHSVLARIQSGGLKLINSSLDKEKEDVHPIVITNNIQALRDTNLIILCVKAYAIKQLINELSLIHDEARNYISAQNGIDVEDVLLKVAKKKQIFRMVINFGGCRLQCGAYRFSWFNAPNYLGPIDARASKKAIKLAELISNTGLKTAVTTQIKSYVYEKTIINCAVSPLCALTNLNIKQAMANSAISEFIYHVLSEARLVGEKIGFKFKDDIEGWMKYLRGVGNHYPSMYIDIKAGKRTEIAWINGKVCEYGKKLGIATPYNKAMETAILGLEHYHAIASNIMPQTNE